MASGAGAPPNAFDALAHIPLNTFPEGVPVPDPDSNPEVAKHARSKSAVPINGLPPYESVLRKIKVTVGQKDLEVRVLLINTQIFPGNIAGVAPKDASRYTLVHVTDWDMRAELGWQEAREVLERAYAGRVTGMNLRYVQFSPFNFSLGGEPYLPPSPKEFGEIVLAVVTKLGQKLAAQSREKVEALWVSGRSWSALEALPAGTESLEEIMSQALLDSDSEGDDTKTAACAAAKMPPTLFTIPPVLVVDRPVDGEIWKHSAADRIKNFARVSEPGNRCVVLEHNDSSDTVGRVVGLGKGAHGIERVEGLSFYNATVVGLTMLHGTGG